MQQDIDKKIFIAEDSLLDADSVPYAVSPNSWVNAENLRFETTDETGTEAGQFIGGTKLLSIPQPSVNYLGNGMVADDENGVIVEFKKNTTGTQDKIVAYYKRDNIEYDVLLSSQVTGGLNFSQYSFIHSAVILNGMVYWVDSTNNEPRKVNIESGIKANNPSFTTNEEAYDFPLNFSEITVIKPPPLLSPNIIKNTDGAYSNNFISNESFEFAFQYIYYDNEPTVPGNYSPASKLNFQTDTFNRIIVTMDTFEFVPLTVRYINLIVRFGNTNNAKVIKTWDRELASENTQIQNQNNQSAALTYNFYNDISGIGVGEKDVLKQSDSVPIYSETVSSAKGRVFFGNNIEGYNAPLETSMQIALGNYIDMSVTSQNAFLFSVKIQALLASGSPYGYSAYYVYLPWASPAGFYEVVSTATLNTGVFTIPPLPPPPITTTYTSGIAYKGANMNEVIQNTKPSGYPNGVAVDSSPKLTSNIIQITGINITNYAVFAQDSPYKSGNVFLDYAGRRCAVVTNDNLTVTTPFRAFVYANAYASIDWSLSNSNAANEIPDWAYYYIPCLTLNQRTRFFIQGWAVAPKYATKDAMGNYIYTSSLYLPNTAAIALDTTSLTECGLGYAYSAENNDQCILVTSGNVRYELPVIGQDANYILLKAKDIGDLTLATIMYEVYTPYKPSGQEIFFDMGNVYQINNPSTVNREYSTLVGSFLPDAFALTRSFNNLSFIVGAMSPNDLFYTRWDNDGGKVNVVSKLGQAIKTQYIRWSNTFIPNTSANGLSTFDFDDEISVPEDCGSITKLILTSKVQDEGSVMLNQCANETNSIYLGEAQIVDSTGSTQFFTQTKGVISTINTLKGNFGTTHAESVIQYRGSVFWWDDISERVVQYASNGLFPISSYKMTRFWKGFSRKFKSLSQSDFDALGSRPFVFAVIDPYHNELLFSIPKVSNDPPRGYLPDYPETIYPFDILDFQAKTIVYKLDKGDGRPKWLGAFTFNSDGFVSMQNELYASKYGFLHAHNQTTNLNEFYGVQNSSKIMVVANKIPTTPKVYNNVSSQSNLVPSFVYFYSQVPVQQSSDLVDNDFRPLEGVWFCAIRRNKLIPTSDGYTTDGLLTGEKMRNQAMLIMWEWRVGNTPLQLQFLNIGFSISRGIPV